MYGRTYSVRLTPTAVSAALDAMLLKPAANKPIIIHKVVLTPLSDETNMQIQVTVMIRASVGDGSGGAALTAIVPKSSHDAAAAFTARQFDTGRATGTASYIANEAFPSQGGFEFLPDVTERPIVFNGEGFVVGIEESMGGASVGGYAIVEEI